MDVWIWCRIGCGTSYQDGIDRIDIRQDECEMVPAKYPCPETILEPLAHHCHATDDVIIYLGISYGWGSLVECLNRYDGPWNDASRIVIERRGIVLTDRYGAATLYPWSHFGIKVPDTY